MCSSAQTLYRHEDKCKAIRSAQLEIDKINQLEQLTLSLKQKEDQYTLFQEQILQYQTQIQEMGMTIQQLKDIQQTQEQEISSSASTINRLNNLVNQQQSRIDSYQDTIVEKNQRINSLEEQAREDRKIIFDFAFKTIELRKQVQDNQCF
jgi:chromosome segregation ATPase